MTTLIHLIYSSAATRHIPDEEMMDILARSRANNARKAVTGMLLYENGSFFQILEGPQEAVDETYDIIAKDIRHTDVVTIIREPIPKRAFAEWTMGYAQASLDDLDEIVGLNDFFAGGTSFSNVNRGRAQKLLGAFRDGRWRKKVQYVAPVTPAVEQKVQVVRAATMSESKVSFSYQPIVDTSTQTIIAYEALLRGAGNKSFADISQDISDVEWVNFDTHSRAQAISTAASLDLKVDLHLNYMARNNEDALAAADTTLVTAWRNGIDPTRIVLEIDYDQLIGDIESFSAIINKYRGAGLRVCIDHFGAGRASLDLLEPMRPEMISLDLNLIRGIESNGPRQAIVRGMLQTCNDLGIDLIAKYVESEAEYRWLVEEGVDLMQGNYLAQAGFESLPVLAKGE
jgi:blue light- and temperature-responsive anti-repressor